MNGNKPIVLLYHQISPKNTKFIENYNINVKPKLFDEHMKIIRDNFNPITFSEWVDAIRNGENISNRILVSFDDGYCDAVNYGGEILNKYDLDGLWFINGGLVNNNKVFWLSQLMYLYDNDYLDSFLKEFNTEFLGLLNHINLNESTPMDIDIWAKQNYSKTLSNSFVNSFSFILKITHFHTRTLEIYQLRIK